MKDALEKYKEDTSKMTESDIEMAEMSVELPYSLPPAHTRKTFSDETESGGDVREAIKKFFAEVGVDTSVIIRCHFS